MEIDVKLSSQAFHTAVTNYSTSFPNPNVSLLLNLLHELKRFQVQFLLLHFTMSDDCASAAIFCIDQRNSASRKSIQQLVKHMCCKGDDRQWRSKSIRSRTLQTSFLNCRHAKKRIKLCARKTFFNLQFGFTFEFIYRFSIIDLQLGVSWICCCVQWHLVRDDISYAYQEFIWHVWCRGWRWFLQTRCFAQLIEEIESMTISFIREWKMTSLR